MRASKHPKLVCTIGPTASGKTEVAVKIAEKFGGEIVNADSRQMYRFLSIGTAKPTPEEMRGIPHHLFDFLDPAEECNVAEWRKLAESTLFEISKRKKLPILCGGTGLFVNALTKNFTIPRIPPQPKFRKKMEKNSAESLWEKLRKVDPEEAERISPKNKRFLIRALEIYEFSGKKKSEIVQRGEDQYDTLLLGLTLEREKLYAKINRRIDRMKARGFLQEVREILQKGYDENHPALQSLGYPETIRFVRGEITEEELWETMKKKTRNYAKRQLTWWRRDERVKWFHAETLKEVDIRKTEY